MKIQIIGRIGEGKTTMAEYLREILTSQVNSVAMMDNDSPSDPEMQSFRSVNREKCFDGVDVIIETVQERRNPKDFL